MAAVFQSGITSSERTWIYHLTTPFRQQTRSGLFYWHGATYHTYTRMDGWLGFNGILNKHTTRIHTVTYHELIRRFASRVTTYTDR